MKKIGMLLTLCLLPVVTQAHTKWYAEGELPPYQSLEPSTLYFLVWGVLAVGIIAIGYYFQQHRLFQLAWLRPAAHHAYERAAATFAMVTGAFLILAGTHDYLFSPNQTAHTLVPEALVVTQILIGVAFLLGIATRTAALGLAGLWLGSMAYVGVLAGIENIWVLSTAIFIFIMGNDYFSLLGKSFFKKYVITYKPYALSILRLGTGAALLVLGFSEKMLQPEYGMNFLAHFNWNFMPFFGINFSDYLFVISAGAVESLLGLIFILGIVTRLNALVVAVFFTIPMFILGPVELAGHMPHFAAIILLLLYGNGGQFVLVKKYQDARFGDE